MYSSIKSLSGLGSFFRILAKEDQNIGHSLRLDSIFSAEDYRLYFGIYACHKDRETFIGSSCYSWLENIIKDITKLINLNVHKLLCIPK